MHYLWMFIVGLVVGVVAKFLTPGKDPGGFIVTGEGKYLGVGSSHDLMATITEMQISAARYANPLTQLPGNVPINEHIDRMLQAGTEFVAAYIDIDNFKYINFSSSFNLN